MGKKQKANSEKKNTRSSITYKRRNRSRSSAKLKRLNIDEGDQLVFNNIIGNSINLNQDDSFKNSVRELIDSLDNLKININEPDSYLELEFPSNLKDQEFIDLFFKGMKIAKKTFQLENLIILKTILKKLLNLNQNKKGPFTFLSDKNEYYKNIIIANQEKIEKIKGKNIKETLENFKQLKEFCLYEKSDIFENAIEYNDYIGYFKIKKFKSLLSSPTILSIYQELISKLYGKKIETKEIEEQLREFRKNHKIFFVDMETGFYGLNIYDGTIIINKSYYKSLNSKQTDVFITFFTLFHEYAHILSLLLTGDKNYFDNTGEFTKKLKKNIKESGEFFEDIFLF